MAAFGVPAAQIARRLATSRTRVDHGLAVAGSKLARGAAERWGILTLDQAAVVAQFDDDDEAVKQLVVAAQHGGFDHKAQQLRDARADAAARAEAAQALTAAGVTVGDRPVWDDKTVKRLRELKQGDQPLTEDNHTDCPRHAAFLATDWIYPESDEDPDGDDPDGELSAEDPDGDEDRDRAKPYRAWVPENVCTDCAAHGHTLRFGGHDSGSGRKPVSEPDDDEREAARAARRDVIQSNKDWDSAAREVGPAQRFRRSPTPSSCSNTWH